MLRRSMGTLVSMLMAVSVVGSAPALGSNANEGFDAFVEDVGVTMLARSPEDATDLGLSATLGLGDDRLDDLSQAYRTETARLAGDALDRLAEFEPETLTPDQRITQAVTRWYLEDIVTMAGYADHEYAVNFITGAHVNLPEFLADVHPLTTAAEADAYVERLRAAAVQLRQVSDNLVRSQEAGIRPTDRGIGIAAWQIGNLLEPGGSHPLVTDLEGRLASLELAEDERSRILEEARTAVEDDLLPAYRDLLETVGAVATRPDGKPGALYHPDGHDYYAAALRHHTTTSLSPEEVHDIGAAEVERMRAELTEALIAAGFDAQRLGFAAAVEAGSAASPSVPLRSDAEREALLGATEQFIADSEQAFGSMFTTLPSSAIEVQRPRPEREGGAGAYYRPPPAVGERPGIYYLNLAGDAFGMNTYATTNYHEAVPGHHFQLALQRESAGLPLIQRAAGFNGYAEGWALYAERLAHEAGLYEDDPLGNIGRLRMELLRAGRAVADTGIHALGWSRSEAIDYLVGLGFPEGWAASEVDRYIVWPGQAPAYLIGMLEILRLRSEAQAALRPDFDLAAFHDAVLRHGSVPVEVLELVVADYVDSVA